MHFVQSYVADGSTGMKILDIKKYGPVYRFTDANLYWTLYYLSKNKTIGRRSLALHVGIGEGSMRNILNILKEWHFVETFNRGIRISQDGALFLSTIPLEVVDLKLSGYPELQNQAQCSVVVLQASSKIQDGLRQRDVCIRSGANGGITIVMKNECLLIPPDHLLAQDNPEFVETISSSSKMNDGDVLIISFAEELHSAANGAIMAALDLI